MGNPIDTTFISVRQTAAQFLATAACELFPKTLLVSGQGTFRYFYYDFYFPFAFQNEMLPVIEERMRTLLRERRPIKRLEMVPSNAAALLEHQGQGVIAEGLRRSRSAVVQMCQIGDAVDFCPYEFSLKGNLGFFKLIEAYDPQIPGKKVTRIVGALSQGKEELKAIVKQPVPSLKDHMTLSRELQLFMPLGEKNQWMWLPKGEQIQAFLSRWWREEHVQQNFNFISSPAPFLSGGAEESMARCHLEFLSKNLSSKTAEIAWLPVLERGDFFGGLFLTAASFTDRAYLSCSAEKLLEETISSLQFILKIPKILGFEFEIALSVSSAGNQKERQKAVNVFSQALQELQLEYTLQKDHRSGVHACIELRILDALGRRWRGPHLSYSGISVPNQKESVLIRSAFGSMERLVGLMLEHTGGQIPFWLAPEQVRILLVGEKSSAWADEVCRGLRDQGVRVTTQSGPELLKTRMYCALREKVPLIVLIGEREEKTKSLTIRRSVENEEKNITIEEFCAVIEGCQTEWKRLI